MLIKTIETIGTHRFAAISSDNTNVTKAARRDVVSSITWIQNLWDCIHYIQGFSHPFSDAQDVEGYHSPLQVIGLGNQTSSNRKLCSQRSHLWWTDSRTAKGWKDTIWFPFLCSINTRAISIQRPLPCTGKSHQVQGTMSAFRPSPLLTISCRIRKSKRCCFSWFQTSSRNFTMRCFSTS